VDPSILEKPSRAMVAVYLPNAPPPTTNNMQAEKRPTPQKRAAPSPEPESLPATKRASKGPRRNVLPSDSVPVPKEPTPEVRPENESDKPLTHEEDALYPVLDGTQRSDGATAEEAHPSTTAEDNAPDNISEVKIELDERTLITNNAAFPFPFKEPSISKIRGAFSDLITVFGGEAKEVVDALKLELYLAEDARFKAESEL
jgi:hypothetical protein